LYFRGRNGPLREREEEREEEREAKWAREESEGGMQECFGRIFEISDTFYAQYQAFYSRGILYAREGERERERERDERRKSAYPTLLHRVSPRAIKSIGALLFPSGRSENAFPRSAFSWSLLLWRDFAFPSALLSLALIDLRVATLRWKWDLLNRLFHRNEYRYSRFVCITSRLDRRWAENRRLEDVQEIKRKHASHYAAIAIVTSRGALIHSLNFDTRQWLRERVLKSIWFPRA